MATPLTQADLDALAAFDTPTVCNALERLVPERRAFGFNRRPLIAPFPSLKPAVGYARTAMIRSREPMPRDKAATRELRLRYYEHIATLPRPSIAVIQDVDGPDVGFGAFWGEVQTHIHKGLGCVGVVTDGAVRDLDAMASGFVVLAGTIMPSHAHVDLVHVGETVSVAGMIVSPGDLIHADRHGAVVIPHHVAKRVAEAAAVIARRERILIDASKQESFTIERLREAFGKADEVH